MPTSCAPVGDCISARTPLPSSVRRSTHDQRRAEQQRQHEQQQLVGRELRAADGHRLGEVVVAAQVAAPHQLGEFCTKNIRPKLTIRPRASNTSRFGDVRARRRKVRRCTSRPIAISTANETGTIHSGDRPKALVRRPREEGAQHQELAVGDVQDAHQPVLQVEPERHERVHAPGDQARGQQFEQAADGTSASDRPGEKPASPGTRSGGRVRAARAGPRPPRTRGLRATSATTPPCHSRRAHGLSLPAKRILPSIAGRVSVLAT